MRLLFLFAAMIAALLARLVVAETATPSVLGPIMPRSLPPPTPVMPDGPPAPEPGTITSVPLPPPDPAPMPAASAPIPLSPTPLALPRLTPTETNPPSAPIVSARLPTPPLSAEASPADFLRAARGALAAGRNGEARSALEMAQTRLLDRSVDAGTESVPSDNLAVKQITEAIDALATNDRMACLRYIEFASRTIGSPLD
jgi:hypothetical protein